MPQYRDLADYITSRSKDLGVTANSLSEALGFSRSYINGIVRGYFTPSSERCQQIADFFGDDVNIILELVGFYSAPPDDDPLIRSILSTVSQLSHYARATVDQFARFLHNQEVQARAKGARDGTATIRCELYGPQGSQSYEIVVPQGIASIPRDEIEDAIARTLMEKTREAASIDKA